jgi:hypothetical protein
MRTDIKARPLKAFSTATRRRKRANRRELPRFRRTRLKLAARLDVSARFSAPYFFTGPKPFNLRPFRRLLLR